MAYTENKKIGGLTAVTTPIGDTDNVVVEQGGTAKKASLLELIAKVFSIGTTLGSTDTSDSAVIIRQNGSVAKTGLNTLVPLNSVTNGMLAGSIADTKLNQLTTAGKVANGATTATNANTPNTIVSRDNSGNFAAGTITATSFSGPATSALTVNYPSNAAGDVLYQSAVGVTGGVVSSGANPGEGTVNKFLRSNGAGKAPTWENFSITSVSADDLAGGVLGAIPYQDAIGSTTFLSPGTDGSVLTTRGAGAAPIYTVTASTNTNNAIVKRDGSGDFTSRNITAAKFIGDVEGNIKATTIGALSSTLTVTGTLTGNASTATKWAAARTLTLAGDLSGFVSFDGGADISLTASVLDNSHNHTDLTNATNANTPSTIVKRDASGNFSAGAITATLVTATTLTGTASAIADGAVSTAAKLASNVVTTAKLPDATTTTDGVTNAKLRQSGGLSVVGRSANTTGAVADITGVDGQVLRVAGTSLGFGTITNAALAGTVVTGHSAETTVNDTDEFLLYRAGTTNALRKITGANLKTSVAPSAPSGSIVKTAFNSVANTSHTNAAISYPTNGPVSTNYASGVEVLSATITPTSASNQIVAHAVISGIDSSSTNLYITGFLVGGTTLLMSSAEDLQQTYQSVTGMSLLGRWSPNSTSQQTIRVYLGASAAGTHTTRTISLFVYEIKA